MCRLYSRALCVYHPGVVPCQIDRLDVECRSQKLHNRLENGYRPSAQGRSRKLAQLKVGRIFIAHFVHRVSVFVRLIMDAMSVLERV